ncbi:MAG TPA: GNAT family N-acetyltransferase [Sphingomicrobium sp.]|nr:GNAT family N-acetyltransferase [Sphingomicrobium sp.]
MQILTDEPALARTSRPEICALTAAATEQAFSADWLSPDQLAANRRIVAISGETARDAACDPDRLFAAAFDERLVGFVISTRHGPLDLELDWLMVHPDYHGSGVATLLMETGLAWLGREQPVWLNVIRHNERAIRFYGKFGFEIDADARTSHAVPHFIMRRMPMTVSGSSGPAMRPAPVPVR